MIEFNRGVDKKGRPNGFYAISIDGKNTMFFKLERLTENESDEDFFDEMLFETLTELKQGDNIFTLWVNKY